MRIVYVFGGRFDPVALGGNAIDIREDLEAMRALGHEVEFRTYEEAPLDVATPIRTLKSRLPGALWNTARDLALLRKNAGWQQRLFTDAGLSGSELVFEYWSPDSFGGAALARKLDVPLVLENLDPLTDERRAGSPSLIGRRLSRAESVRRRQAAALIVMSRGMGEHLVAHDGIDPARVHWLPQGVNTERFQPPAPAARDAARAKLGVGDKRLVGFVGSMASYQRVDLLVDAGRMLVDRREDTQLVLVGGTKERAVAAGAGDDVIVVPHVDYAEVPAIVGAFDVAVLPDSNWYGSPVKVLEYAAVGVPIVAPDVGPVRDLIEPEGGAKLVRPGSAEALADAIEAVLDDAGAAVRAAAFRERVLERFDRHDRTRRLLDLCGQLVDGQ